MPGAKTLERICTIVGSKRVKSGKNVLLGVLSKTFYPATNSEKLHDESGFFCAKKYKSWPKRCGNPYSNRKQPMGISNSGIKFDQKKFYGRFCACALKATKMVQNAAKLPKHSVSVRYRGQSLMLHSIFKAEVQLN